VSQKAYLLEHFYNYGWELEHTETKTLGIYSSKEAVALAVERYSKLPGFDEFPLDCFRVREYQTDEDAGWHGGFSVPRREIVIDGGCFHDWGGFYDEIERKFMSDAVRAEYRGKPYPVGRNLNAFNDILRGGFGIHDFGTPIHIKWVNFDKNIYDFGEKAMDTIVEIILDSDSGHNCTLEKL